MKPIKLIKILYSCLITAFLLSTNVSAKSLDPLNTAEVNNALSLSTLRQSRSAQAQSNTTHDLEVLLVERRPTDKDQPNQRLADIYRYDYNSDETLHTVIDLDKKVLFPANAISFYSYH